MSNMVVRTNVLALNSHRNLGNVANQQARSSARLSSGFRINSAADDAAGLAISEGMRAQIRGLDQASRNSQDAISLIQTTEGGMQTIGEMVGRIRELVVQASNDTYTGGADGPDRGLIQREVGHLLSEINDTAARLEFNRRSLLDSGDSLFFQVGANASQGITLTLPNVVTSVHTALVGTLGAGGANINNADGSAISAFLSGVDTVMDSLNDARATLGAVENRLEFTIQNLDISSQNLSAANSRIRDADMAQEMMRLTQANVLQQAATAMLAQANQAPQSVLQLLG